MGVRIEFKPNAGKYYGGTRDGEAEALQQSIKAALTGFLGKLDEFEIGVIVRAFYICNTGRVKAIFLSMMNNFAVSWRLGGPKLTRFML